MVTKNIFLSLKNYYEHVKPMGIIFAVLLILSNLAIISILNELSFKVLGFIIPSNTMILNNISIFINFINSLISLFILFYLNSAFHYPKKIKGNFLFRDFIYLFFIALFFRLIFDNIFFPLTSFVFTSLNLYARSTSAFLLINTCVFAPISEEFFYRGLLLNGFLKKYSPFKSIILSSLIFALMHSNLVQCINAFLFALMIGYIFYSTKSIVLAISIHFFNNILVFIIPSEFSIPYFYFLFLLPILIIFIVFLLRKLSNKKEKNFAL